jgi:hypothetical protein
MAQRGPRKLPHTNCPVDNDSEHLTVKGKKSFVHPNYKPVSTNPETSFCKMCGEEKQKTEFRPAPNGKRYGIDSNCKICRKAKERQRDSFLRCIVPTQSTINEIPSYLLRLSSEDVVSALTKKTARVGKRVTCKADGCFEESAMNWKFCTKHRYFFEKFGSEVPPKTLSCPCCNKEKDIAEFFVKGTHNINASGSCNQCLEEKRKESRRNKNKERHRRLKINNPAKWQEIKRKRNKKKMERIKNDPVAYAKKRKIHRTCCINRRARKKGNGGTHTKEDIQFLMDTQKGKCVCCRKDIRKKYHIDHIVPIALGGGSEKTNLQLLCPTCNTRKCAKHPTVFMQENGFLI